MTIVFMGRLNTPNYTALSTDIIGGELPGAQPGMIVYISNTKDWYIVKADLTLTAYSLPVDVSGDITVGTVDQGSPGALPWLVEGHGTAGTPDGGVMTVQGDGSGEPLPVTTDGLTNTELRLSPVSVSMAQDVTADAKNSSVAAIAAGATWEGTVSSTLGVAGIQVNIYANQNCEIYVDQSMDGLNFDITDIFLYYSSASGNSWTIQATASYYRVRVKNISASNATTVRIQTALCPIVESLPRALSDRGHLKTAIYEMESPGFLRNFIVSPMGAQKTAKSVRLVGSSFQGAVIDSRFWVTSLGTGGVATQAEGEFTLGTGTTSANISSVTTSRTARYVGANPNYFRSQINLPAVTTAAGHSNTRRWGAYDPVAGGDGYFFEAIQTNPATSPTLKIYSRKAGTDSTAVTSFNGDLGSTYTLDLNVHVWEIYWTNATAWFFVDGIFLHKIASALTPSVGTPSLKASMLTSNTGAGADNNNTIVCRSMTINRLGELLTQPQYYYQSGTTTGVVVKYGTGNFHRINVGSQLTNSVVTIYDGTTTGGSVIFSYTYTQGAQGNNQPFSLDFNGVPFSTGLFLVVGGANSNVTVIYE